ncbi:hypothetical protein CSOJ01_14799 [Colletotrichum sojae]|uniref:Uncharacterized protein n=1 Tax=Colletotrichum sojae TaxID=2175907 RepID=A0A8H6MIL6_9PEZI|nr:hypothetical protein CSOJ01_14799 [Colletotrichum sojae]
MPSTSSFEKHIYSISRHCHIPHLEGNVCPHGSGNAHAEGSHSKPCRLPRAVDDPRAAVAPADAHSSNPPTESPSRES